MDFFQVTALVVALLLLVSSLLILYVRYKASASIELKTSGLKIELTSLKGEVSERIFDPKDERSVGIVIGDIRSGSTVIGVKPNKIRTSDVYVAPTGETSIPTEGKVRITANEPTFKNRDDKEP